MAEALDERPERGADPEPIEAQTEPHRRPIAPFVAIGVAVLIAAFVVVAAGLDGGSADTADSSLLDQPAPDVRTTTIDGEAFDLSTRRGSWAVVNFFGTWCPPCVREHPEFVRFAETQESAGGEIELYSVINNDSVANVRAFFAENGGDWPILRDDDGAISVAFGVAKVPETWIIDPFGIVRARIISNVDASLLTSVLDQVGAAT
jgi:cytochrome c biogenesis protein CcmG, thiol:disulfide interchange protein DsbE